MLLRTKPAQHTHLGGSLRLVPVLPSEVDLPDIPVFVPDDELKDARLGMHPASLAQRVGRQAHRS